MRFPNALATSLALALLACNEVSTPFGDQSGTSGRVKPPELQGALQAELGSDWKDFDRALATINPWTGGHQQNRCSDALLCGLGFSKVPVRIQANPEANYADSTNVGTFGTILMKIVNVGKRRTEGYDLAPSPLEYYVVVKHTDPARWEWRLVETGGISPARLVGGWQPFHNCEHVYVPKKSSANFQRCSDPEPDPLKKAGLFDLTTVSHTLAQGMQSLFGLESPGWISCAYGCCTLAD